MSVGDENAEVSEGPSGIVGTQVVQTLLLRVFLMLLGMLVLLLIPLVVQTLLLKVALMLQGMLVLFR